jgi:hypothetical protein
LPAADERENVEERARVGARRRGRLRRLSDGSGRRRAAGERSEHDAERVTLVEVGRKEGAGVRVAVVLTRESV